VGGHADAVDESRRRVFEELDELPAAADETAAAGQRLRHGAAPQLDVGAVDAEVFADAAAGRTEHADAVRLVDHEQRLVLALDLDEGRQVGDVTVLAVDAFDDDQHPAVLVTDAGEQLIERGRIVVRERPARGAGELAALHDAVVREAVVDHEVAFAEQVPDHGDVGGVSADQCHRVFCAE
jgi:hypothetical protein